MLAVSGSLVKTILLIDDDRDLCALIGSALSARGHRVLQAGSGASADALLLEESVHLVVIDGALPDTSGISWVERFRKNGRSAPVVFLSAVWRDLQTFQRLTDELDVAFVLYKPVDPNAFGEQIDTLLKPPRLDPALEKPLEHLLKDLQKNYASRLPNKLDELAATLKEAQLDSGKLPEARTLAHRLRGTAGSYGFSSVGAAVGRVEEGLIDLESSSHSHRHLWPRIEQALADAMLAVGPTASPSGGAFPAEAKTRSLLVFDSDGEFVRTVSALARSQLLEVAVASSSGEALDKARRTRLVGAFVDAHADAPEGFALCRKLRKLAGLEALPITVTSLDGRMHTRVLASEAGASLFLEKPVTEVALTSALNRMVEGSQLKSQRTLIVDDDPDFTDRVALLLRGEGLDVRVMRSSENLIEVLEGWQPELLILDLNLPEVSGLAVCRALRNSARWQTLPVLVVTSNLDDETRLAAYRAGASDFLSKPPLDDEILARVRVRLDYARLLVERSEQDYLTGLLLRRAFHDAAERLLSLSKRENRPVSLVLMDLDGFKEINDTYGHLSGDRVLAALGQLLRQRFRIEDVRGRWGGEEFILMLASQDASFCATAVERLLHEFSNIAFTGAAGETFHATFTAGIATYPDDGTSLEALLRRADERLYRGKRDGRRRVVVG